METCADDLAAVVQALDLHQAIHVGHSTGGGEVARYIGRHGTSRVAKAVLISAVPLMLKTAANPGGLPIEAFDAIRAGVLTDRSQQAQGFQRPVLRRQSPWRDRVTRRARFVLDARHAGRLQGRLRLHQGVLETDFTEDLKKIDVPTLIMHGDGDQIVPIGASAMLSAKLVKGSTLKALVSRTECAVNKDRINADLLAFIKA